MSFNPDEPRDYHGRWGAGDRGSPASAAGHAHTVGQLIAARATTVRVTNKVKAAYQEAHASAAGHADGVIHGMNPLDARIESLRQGVIATRAKEGKAKFLTDRILLERQATAFEHTISELKQQRAKG